MPIFRKRRITKRRSRRSSSSRRNMRSGRRTRSKLLRRGLTFKPELKEVNTFKSHELGPWSTGPDSGAWQLDNVHKLTPGGDAGDYQITQGPGQGQRIGNKIRTQKVMLKGVLSINPIDAQNILPVPIELKVWFMRRKRDFGTPNASDMLNLFQDGNANSSLTGTLRDMIMPFNSDFFTLYKSRQFKLGFAQADSAFNSQANNDFKMNIKYKVDLTRAFPTNMTYNDTVPDTTAHPVYMVWQVVYANGAQILNHNQHLACKHFWSLTYKYSDM